jgi:hypothetical protein
MDNGSPSLTHASASKTQFANTELNFFVGADNFMTVTLEKVIVTSVGVKMKPGATRPFEEVTLSYRIGTWRVGTASTRYNLETASALTGATSSALTAPLGSSSLLAPVAEISTTDSSPLRKTKKRPNRTRTR